MPDKLWFRPWDILGRLGIAISAGIFIWMWLPPTHSLPTLVVIVQLILYLTLLVYPPKLHAILLSDQIEERAKTSDNATIELLVPSTEVGNRHITIQAAVVWGTVVEKSVRVRFARDLATARMRRMHDSFLVSFVPVVMVVGLTCVLSILQQELINAGNIGRSPVAFVIPFLQGLIGLIPFVWIVGNLLGEVTCHRDTVFKALG